ncbi:MAG TPA: VOC family protein [Thermomicrobiales bacterium]|nr:VOC family protein [Thermomicrobiales bacterium]
MNTPTTHFKAPIAAPQLLSAPTRLGAVHLDVIEGNRSRAFWTEVVGLTPLDSADDEIVLGIDDQPMIVLHPGATGPVARRHTGLYHVAIHLPAKKELARVVARLYGLRVPNSPTDHAETMATYFSDPDGNNIELTFETPERGALVLGDGRGAAIMADGTTQGPTEALDVQLLFDELDADDDLMAPMPSGTRIGHVHLHVTDLAAGRHFYRNLIGLGDLRALDAWGMTDLSLATSFVPHALALNVWNGPSATPRPEKTAGLRYWTLHVSADDIEGITRRLDDAQHTWREIPEGIAIDDPSGNELRVIPE